MDKSSHVHTCSHVTPHVLLVDMSCHVVDYTCCNVVTPLCLPLILKYSAYSQIDYSSVLKLVST